MTILKNLTCRTSTNTGGGLYALSRRFETQLGFFFTNSEKFLLLLETTPSNGLTFISQTIA